jgi:hypothetical protein
MTDLVAESLGADVAAGRLVIVAGAGVSIAASGGNELASWVGLLRNGIEVASSVGQPLPVHWKKHAQAELEMAVNDSYTPSLISVAEKVTTALGGRDSGEFHRWLGDSVGSLTVASTELPLAIAGLDAPITTTNYDDLLEVCLNRAAVTWRDPSQAQGVLVRKDNRAILHLHGCWRTPESVILGAQSYGQILDNVATQALQRGIATNGSILFVGCGDGLKDPNFAALRRWLSETFGSSALRHYLLCLNSDLRKLQRVYSSERIMPVSYGSQHEDLPNFLRSLWPSKTAVGPLGRSSRLELRVSGVGVVEEGADTTLDNGRREVDRLTLPPRSFSMGEDVPDTLSGRSSTAEMANRRWAAVSRRNSTITMSRAGTGPSLRSLAEPPISAPEDIDGDTLVSADGRVVASLLGPYLELAWVNRLVPRLCPWPEAVRIGYPDTELLAIAMSGTGAVRCVFNLHGETFMARVAPTMPLRMVRLRPTPSLLAVISINGVATVASDGVSEDEWLQRGLSRLRTIRAIDLAEARAGSLLAGLGADVGGTTTLVTVRNSGQQRAMTVESTTNFVIVVRPLDPGIAPHTVLTVGPAGLRPVEIG